MVCNGPKKTPKARLRPFWQGDFFPISCQEKDIDYHVESMGMIVLSTFFSPLEQFY